MTAVGTGRTGTSGRLADLTLHVGGYELGGLKLAVSERFTRLTTVVTLHGAGHRGVVEDTTYAPPARLVFRSAGTVLPVAGDWSLDTFSAALGADEAVPVAPERCRFPQLPEMGL